VQHVPNVALQVHGRQHSLDEAQAPPGEMHPHWPPSQMPWQQSAAVLHAPRGTHEQTPFRHIPPQQAGSWPSPAHALPGKRQVHCPFASHEPLQQSPLVAHAEPPGPQQVPDAELQVPEQHCR